MRTLAKLLHRFFHHVRSLDITAATQYEMYPLAHISNAIGLLVSLPLSVETSYSIAIIGFSLSGKSSHKKKLRKDRTRNLQCLESVDDEGERWRVGNCAESENFAHVEHFLRVLEEEHNKTWNNEDSPRDISVERKTFSVCLTFKFGPGVTDLSPTPFCSHCRKLAYLVGQRFSSPIVDLNSF
jgi:hypothetical protein